MNIGNLIDCCIGSKGSHYDVSRVTYAILKTDFRYDGNNIWYFRNSENQWVIDEQRRELEVRIKIDVSRAFTERALYWQNIAISAANGHDYSLKIDSQLRSVKLLDICMKISKPRYIRELIKECRSFFVQDD
jgi:hypothetical protein